ncbi:MAG TPA: hypothetical protein VIL97_03720 [Thermoanaerobaculia bacterium]
MKVNPKVRAFGRSLRLSLALLLDRRLGLLLTVDLLVLFSITVAVLSGAGSAPGFYTGVVLIPILFLGIPILADSVALERRAGSLDLALSSPGAPSYFERRVLSFAAFLITQSTLLILFARLFIGPFPLWAALIQATLIALLLASLILFWGVRVRTAGAVIFGTVVSFAALGKWTFSNPIEVFKVTQWTATLDTTIVWVKPNVVIALATIVFYSYARRRLTRPESLLS